MTAAAPIIVGSLIGFFGSIPIAGPVSATVAKRAIEGRFDDGMRVALGGALAKGGYACLALWGFDAVLSPYPLVKPLSLGIGALFLLVLGVGLLRRPVSSGSRASRATRPDGGVLLGFAMTAANPTLLATFTGLVAVLHSYGVASLSEGDAVPFGAGTALGMVVWFGLLLSLVRRLPRRSLGSVGRWARPVGAVIVLGLAAWFAVGACLGIIALAAPS